VGLFSFYQGLSGFIKKQLRVAVGTRFKQYTVYVRPTSRHK